MVKTFDWSLHHNYSRMAAPGRGFDGGRRGSGRGFDAAGSSGLAFLQSSLELINPKLVEPLQAVTHPRDMPIEFGGGFPDTLVAWASNYGSTGSGTFGLQGTANSDIPIAQADVEKGSWATFNWSQGFTIPYIDLERMKFASSNGNQPPYTLQSLYEKSVRTVWAKALDLNAYLGFLGNPGLINNPNVPAVVAGSGGSGTTWQSKSPVQILNDINFSLNTAVENSGYAAREACPDTLLLPYNQFALLSQPMTIGGVGYNSTMDYVRKNCVAASIFGNAEQFKIFSLPNPWISGQGIGNTAVFPTIGNGLDRAVFYRKDKDNIMMKVPTAMTPAMTIPTEKGPGYSTFFVGCIGAVQFFRTQTVIYLDGV